MHKAQERDAMSVLTSNTFIGMKLYYENAKDFMGRFRKKEILDGSPCAILQDNARLRAIVNELDKTGYFSQGKEIGSVALTKRNVKKALFGLHDAVEAIRGGLQLTDRRAEKHIKNLYTANMGLVAGFVLDGPRFAGDDRQKYLDASSKETVDGIRKLADALSIELIQTKALLNLFNQGIQKSHRLDGWEIRSLMSKDADPYNALKDAIDLYMHEFSNERTERVLFAGASLVILTGVHELAMQTYPKLS